MVYQYISLGFFSCIGGSRGRIGGPDPPEKSQMAKYFHRNTRTDPLEKHLDPKGPIAEAFGP